MGLIFKKTATVVLIVSLLGVPGDLMASGKIFSVTNENIISVVSGNVIFADDTISIDGENETSEDISLELETDTTLDKEEAVEEDTVKEEITIKETLVKRINYKRTKKVRTILKDKVKVLNPFGRKLLIQVKKNGRWITKKRIKLNRRSGTSVVNIKFPNYWQRKTKTKWRFVIKKNKYATGFVSKTINVKAKRYYQNPKKYVQIKRKISTHGYDYYTSPVLTDLSSTKKECIEAMITTAYKYLGDPYVVCKSGKPREGIDCSGLVMQACYGAGVDLYPSNPYRHQFREYEYESRNIAEMDTLKTVDYSDAKRGDLIFYSKNGVVIHVAIYLGNGKIIHSWPGVVISDVDNPRWGTISKVKRIFN